MDWLPETILEQQDAVPMVLSPIQQTCTLSSDSSLPCDSSADQEGRAPAQSRTGQQLEIVSTLADARLLSTPADADLRAVLGKTGFPTKAAALSWLAEAGYEKADNALTVLGVSCPSDVILLQAHQVDSVKAFRLAHRGRMSFILGNLVTDSDRLESVLEQQPDWLEMTLGIEKAGIAAL